MRLKAYSPYPILSMVLVAIFLLSIGSLNPSAFSEPQKSSDDSRFLLPQKKESGLTLSENRGKTLYQYYCAICHGDKGNGDGFNSFSITPPPAKLSDEKLVAALSDDTIQKTIKKGGGEVGLSPHMPAWGGVLTDKNIADLTLFIRTLSNPKKRDAPPPK